MTEIVDSSTSGDKMAGKTLVVKDNIHVAGVPMCCGSNFMRGFVSSHTATVVSRALAAGLNTFCLPYLAPWLQLRFDFDSTAVRRTLDCLSKVIRVIRQCQCQLCIYIARSHTASYCAEQWRIILTGGPWTNFIKGPILHFEFTEEFIIIKVLTKITIKRKTMMKCEVKSNFIIKAKMSV